MSACKAYLGTMKQMATSCMIPCLGIPAGSLYCPDQYPHQCGIHTCISVCHRARRQGCPFHQLQVPFQEPMGSSISKDNYKLA